MSLSLGDVLTAARDRSRAFFQTNAPNAVLARYLSDVQNDLITKAVQRDRQFLAQSASIVIAISSDDTPGTVGAGTSGGVPGTTDGDTFTTSESTTGSVIEAGVTEADGAVVLMQETVVASATPTTVTVTGASRTVNADVGMLVVVTAGAGFGQRREVVSNTADTWTISTGSDGFQWVTEPDTTSLVAIVQPALTSDDTAGAVTALPSTTQSDGYLVKLDSSGVPYIDFTDPLTATVEQGVPLPTMHAVIPDLCQVWRTGCPVPEPLWVTSASRRFAPERFPAVYVIGQTLYLTGQSEDWSDIASLELRYVPVAPVFTRLTDLFLLPDSARSALVARAAAFMAIRVQGVAGVTLDPTPLLAEAQAEEATWLRTVMLNTRGRTNRVREVW